MTAFVEIMGTGLVWIGLGLSPLILLPIIILVVRRPTARFARFVTQVLDRISGAAFALAMIAALAIIMIQLAGVLLRYVFGLSFSWLTDSVIFSFAMIFMLGAAATLRDDGHVRVDILRGRFSSKVKAGIELVGSLGFIIPIGVLILYAGSGLISRSWIGLEPFNESDGLPIKFLFKTLVPVFAVLMIGQAISQATKAAIILAGLRKDAPAAEQQEGAV